MIAKAPPQIDLVFQEGFVGRSAADGPRHGDVRQRRSRRHHLADGRLDIAVAAPVPGVAKLVVKRPAAAEVMSQRRRRDIRADMRIVVPEAVEVAPGHSGGAAGVAAGDVDPQRPIVGPIPLRLVHQANGQLGPTAEADAERRRDADPFHADHVAPGHIRAVSHGGQPERRVRRDRRVDVRREAREGVGADAQRGGVERTERRRLAHVVDHSAGRSASEDNRRRSGEHLDRVQVEGIAVVLAEIELAAAIDVEPGAEAADLDVRALAAVLVRVGADAGVQAQHVAQVRQGVQLDHRGGDHVDRLRRARDRLGEQRRVGALLGDHRHRPDRHAGRVAAIPKRRARRQDRDDAQPRPWTQTTGHLQNQANTPHPPIG